MLRVLLSSRSSSLSSLCLLSPLSLGPGYNEELDLLGIADFNNSNDQVTPVLLKIETNTGADHFVAFNRATGVNEDVPEARDLVTVVRVNQNDGVSLSDLVSLFNIHLEKYSIEIKLPRYNL